MFTKQHGKMKHLIIVHSHITFLVAKKYVDEAHIKNDDVVFFCSRQYLPPLQFQNDYHFLSYPDDIFMGKSHRVFSKNLFSAYKNLEILEKTIRTLFCSNDFFLYTPNCLAMDFESAAVTMKLCKGFYLLEEGSGSYKSAEDLPEFAYGWKKAVFKFIVKPLFYRFYALRGSFFETGHKKYRGTVAVSTLAFPETGGEHILVSNPFMKQYIDTIPDAVLSVDASLDMFFTIDEIEYIYRKINEHCEQNGIKVLAYKFHPDYYSDKTLMNQYRNLIEKVFVMKTIELSSDIAIENILNTYHADFYSDFSSVAIYADTMGVNCYSYANLLNNKFHNKEYEKAISKFPAFIRNKYQFI